MNIKIDKGGCLKIKRKEEFKDIECPFQKGSYCGDWCALFGEPQYYTNNKPEKRAYLDICKKEFDVKEKDFTDERK